MIYTATISFWWMLLNRYASTWLWKMDFTKREWKKNWSSKDEM